MGSVIVVMLSKECHRQTFFSSMVYRTALLKQHYLYNTTVCFRYAVSQFSATLYSLRHPEICITKSAEDPEYVDEVSWGLL